MNERPPRPRAFRLDDARVAVDDARSAPAPAAIIQSQHEPIPPMTSTAPIDEAELEVEAAQKSGASLALALQPREPALVGRRAALPRSPSACWTTNLIEGLFAKAESLGIIGLAFGVLSPRRPRRR